MVGRWSERGKKLLCLLIYLDFRNNNKPIYFYVQYVYYCLMYFYIWICYNQQHWLWINKIKRLSFITIKFYTLLYPVRVTKRNWKAVSRLFVAVIKWILMNLLLFIAVRIFQVVKFFYHWDCWYADRGTRGLACHFLFSGAFWDA